MPNAEIEKLIARIAWAKIETLDQVLDRAAKRDGGSLSFAFVVKALGVERERTV